MQLSGNASLTNLPVNAQAASRLDPAHTLAGPTPALPASSSAGSPVGTAGNALHSTGNTVASTSPLQGGVAAYRVISSLGAASADAETETGSHTVAGESDETVEEGQSATVSSEHGGETEPASGYTEQELKEIELLAARDLEVRQHEQAHAAAGGQYAGAPSYELTRGPDGRMYATGGEVMIDTSEVPGDPAATIQKMQTVISSALAPAEPSSQDRQVAAEATAMMQQAQAELVRAEQSDESDEVDEVAETDESSETAEADESGGNTGVNSSAESARDNGAAGSRLASPSSEPWDARPRSIHSFQPSAEQQALERRLMHSGVLAEQRPAGSLIEQLV